jgi:hypothetical protein
LNLDKHALNTGLTCSSFLDENPPQIYFQEIY